MVAAEAALQRFAQRRDLLAQRALGQLSEDLGVVGAADSASSISRADLPSTSEATDESLIPASCSVFSTRWTSRPRSWILALR